MDRHQQRFMAGCNEHSGPPCIKGMLFDLMSFISPTLISAPLITEAHPVLPQQNINSSAYSRNPHKSSLTVTAVFGIVMEPGHQHSSLLKQKKRSKKRQQHGATTF